MKFFTFAIGLILICSIECLGAANDTNVTTAAPRRCVLGEHIPCGRAITTNGTILQYNSDNGDTLPSTSCPWIVQAPAGYFAAINRLCMYPSGDNASCTPCIESVMEGSIKSIRTCPVWLYGGTTPQAQHVNVSFSFWLLDSDEQVSDSSACYQKPWGLAFDVQFYPDPDYIPPPATTASATTTVADTTSAASSMYSSILLNLICISITLLSF